MLGENAAGTTGGKLRCVALWDIGNRDGVLLRREDRTLLCDYISIVTKEKAFEERALSMRLAALAEETKEAQGLLDHSIPDGRWSLHELPHSPPEQMGV